MYRSIFNHCYVIGANPTEFGEIMQTTWPLRRSGSFKVTDFGSNWKPKCDFLLVINTNLPSILHRFQVMADYWSNFASDRGCFTLTNPLGVIPYEYPDKLYSSETRRIVLPDAENRTIVSSFILTKHGNVTEWQTGRNGLASTARPHGEPCGRAVKTTTIIRDLLIIRYTYSYSYYSY